MGSGGAGVGSKFMNFQTVICSGPGILSEAIQPFKMRFAFTLKESIVGVDHLTFEVRLGDLVSVRNFFPKPLVWVWGMFKWLAAGTYVFYQRNIFRFRNMALIISLRGRENL